MKIKSHTEIDYEKIQVFRLTRQNDDDPEKKKEHIPKKNKKK